MKREKVTTTATGTTSWVQDVGYTAVPGVRHYYHRDASATPRCEDCTWGRQDPEAGGVLYECTNPAVYDQPTTSRRLGCHGCDHWKGAAP